MEKIIPFESSLSTVFRDLNLQWLEHFFYVEPHDRDLLENCEEVIINKGGFIFFYQVNDHIIGTFALIKVTEGTYELGKMAVSNNYRGKGIGKNYAILSEICTSSGMEKINSLFKYFFGKFYPYL